MAALPPSIRGDVALAGLPAACEVLTTNPVTTG